MERGFKITLGMHENTPTKTLEKRLHNEHVPSQVHRMHLRFLAMINHPAQNNIPIASRMRVASSLPRIFSIMAGSNSRGLASQHAMASA